MGGTRLRTGRRTVKGVTGYDVTALLVGSEGTLAVFSEADAAAHAQAARSGDAARALRATCAPPGARSSAIVAAASSRAASSCSTRARSTAVRERGVAVDERAGALLLIEVDGDARACEEQAERVGDACAGAGALDVLVAQDAAQRERLWAARREMSPAVRGARAVQDLRGRRRAARSASPSCSTRSSAPRRRPASACSPTGTPATATCTSTSSWNDPADEPRVVSARIEQLFRDVVAMRRHALRRARHRHRRRRPTCRSSNRPSSSRCSALERRLRSEGAPQPGQDLPRGRDTARADMIVLGIDPGTRHLGLGRRRARRHAPRPRRARRHRHRHDGELAERLCEIERELTEVVATLRPTASAVEALFFAKDATRRGQARARARRGAPACSRAPGCRSPSTRRRA